MRYPLDEMKIRPLQFTAYKPLTNTFGMVRTKAGRSQPHQGWDLSTLPGTPVYAITDGEARYGFSGSYGHTVTLKFSHNGTIYYAFYAHLAPVSSPLFFDRSVREGDLVGYTGMSGNAVGIPAAEAHLHFEIRIHEIPASGLAGRVDPGEVFGYGVYSCSI